MGAALGPEVFQHPFHLPGAVLVAEEEGVAGIHRNHPPHPYQGHQLFTALDDAVVGFHGDHVAGNHIAHLVLGVDPVQGQPGAHIVPAKGAGEDVDIFGLP